MNDLIVRIRRLLMLWTLLATSAQSHEFETVVRPLLENYCIDCHDASGDPKGGINLERFVTDVDVMADRSLWASVFEKIETLQMPPPKRKNLPTSDERKQILAWVKDIAARPDPHWGVQDPGKAVLRRMTRLEYNNTLRDLLGLETDVLLMSERLPLASRAYFQPQKNSMGDAVKVSLLEYGAKYPVLLPAAGLPADNRAEHGFRNRGEAFNLSPLALEQYLAFAKELVHSPKLPNASPVFANLLGLEPVKPSQVKSPAQSDSVAVGIFAPKLAHLERAPGSADNAPQRFREDVLVAYGEGRGGVFDMENLRNQTIAGKGGSLRVVFGEKTLVINPNEDLWLAGFGSVEATSGGTILTNKIKGGKKYELKLDVLDGDVGEGISRLAVMVLGRKGAAGQVAVTARFSDETVETLKAELAEGVKNTTFFSFAALPGETVKFLEIDGTGLSGDYVVIDDLGFITNGQPRKIRAPLVATDQAEEQKEKPHELPVTMKKPQDRFADFARLALRRPIPDADLQPYLLLLDQALADGQSEADAMRRALLALLASPSFLYLTEPVVADQGKVRALDGFELATRLSYFLWASMPDQRLLELATSGQLLDENVLEIEARRMLKDPRAKELSESFAVQWLRLDQLNTSKPDRELFKDFYSGPQGKSTLHGAMLIEALLLFETVMVEDRSILEFVDANYTWLRPSLMKLYGFDKEDGDDETQLASQGGREVRLPDSTTRDLWQRVALPDRKRGGFMSMGGTLTVTSLPFRTSPVKRGAWLLETLFNRPPSEPKVAFAIENDTKEEAQVRSVREKFEAHRNQEACYSCHIRLDPPGFALERFDPIGAWRDKDGPQKIDATSEWNGVHFDGPEGFKELLIQKPHEFVRGFSEHLLSYALCRKLEVYDMPTIQSIVERTTEDGFRFSRVVAEVVKSYPFRHARNDAR